MATVLVCIYYEEDQVVNTLQIGHPWDSKNRLHGQQPSARLVNQEREPKSLPKVASGM